MTMKNYFAIIILAVTMVCTQSYAQLTNLDFEEDLAGWTVEAKDDTTITIDQGAGLEDSKALKMTLETQGVAEVKQVFTGLETGKCYLVTGWVKGEEIKSRGNIGANFGISGSWMVSGDGLTGTFDWKEVKMSFIATDKTESFSIRLGFWYNDSEGTAWFDNFSIEEQAVFKAESPEKHIRLNLPAQYVKEEDKPFIAEWLKQMDDVYKVYEEFMGGVPYDGKTIDIYATLHNLPGAWAWAGNPIYWTGRFVESELESLRKGNWSFGILHEIAHDFAINDQSYNWNEEMFANLRMYYALEKLGGTVHQGGSIRDHLWLKEFYRTVGGEQFNHDNHMYYLLTVKDEIGWEPFKATIQELGSRSPERLTPLEKFNLFFETLARHGGTTPDRLLAPVAIDKINELLKEKER